MMICKITFVSRFTFKSAQVSDQKLFICSLCLRIGYYLGAPEKNGNKIRPTMQTQPITALHLNRSSKLWVFASVMTNVALYSAVKLFLCCWWLEWKCNVYSKTKEHCQNMQTQQQITCAISVFLHQRCVSLWSDQAN